MADSQDMFDAIVMADERFHGEGYQEGYEEGSSLGMIEGRQYGTLHGAKIGSEIGCYQGFALVWKCLLRSCASEKDSRKMKVLESLIGMIQKFPYDDPTYNKLHEDLDKIRGKFKQATFPGMDHSDGKLTDQLSKDGTSSRELTFLQVIPVVQLEKLKLREAKLHSLDVTELRSKLNVFCWEIFD